MALHLAHLNRKLVARAKMHSNTWSELDSTTTALDWVSDTKQ
jgi:hypothetical protein